MARVRVEVPVPEEESSPAKKASSKFTSSSKAILVRLGVTLGFLLLIIVIISLARDRDQLKQEVQQSNQASNSQAESEATQLTSEIGQYLELPQEETPTVVLVSDASKLKDQAFFKNAQDGDKVLLFSEARKAILYRPSTKKVIEFSTFTLPQSSTKQQG